MLPRTGRRECSGVGTSCTDGLSCQVGLRTSTVINIAECEDQCYNVIDGMEPVKF